MQLNARFQRRLVQRIVPRWDKNQTENIKFVDILEFGLVLMSLAPNFLGRLTAWAADKMGDTN